MAQKKKHLRELLREEQEPFLLKSFIQERREGLLRRLPPSPKSQQQAHKKSALIIPASPPTKSPLLFPVLHHPSSSNPPKRTTSLLDIAAVKSPTSTLINPTGYFILEAALRIQENKQKERSHSSRRSIRALGLFGSVFKRLVSSRKPRREIQGRRDHVTLSVKDILVWDSPHAGNCRKRIQVANCHERRPSSAKRRSPSHGHGHGMENNDGDGDASARKPDDDIHQHQESSFSSSDDGRATSSSSSSSSEENGSSSVGSDESRTPELASPPHRKTEGQLVGGTGPEKEYDEERQEKEQQLSPVSVLELDPTLEEEEEEEEEEEHLEGHVELYERSLAIVERSKRQLMHHLLRFQRLASLDPIELDLLLAQEEEEEEEHHHVHQYSDADADDADDGNDSDSIMLHTQNQPEEEEDQEIHLLIMKDILGYYWPSKACSCSLMPCPCEKAPKDMKKLTLDLIDEEKSMKHNTTEQLDNEEALLLEKVCKRFEAWKEVESNTIDMMVGLDLRPESQEWEGRCKDQVGEIAALIEIAIFELLLCEFSDEQLRTNDDQLQLVS